MAEIATGRDCPICKSSTSPLCSRGFSLSQQEEGSFLCLVRAPGPRTRACGPFSGSCDVARLTFEFAYFFCSFKFVASSLLQRGAFFLSTARPFCLPQKNGQITPFTIGRAFLFVHLAPVPSLLLLTREQRRQQYSLLFARHSPLAVADGRS